MKLFKGDWNVGARGLVHLIPYVWREAPFSGLSAAYPGLLKEETDDTDGVQTWKDSRLLLPKHYSLRIGRIWLDGKTMNNVRDVRE